MKHPLPEKPTEVARLYQIFGRYQSRAQTMSACPCCVKKSEIAALFAVPLQDLKAETLSRYSSKAMTTWGDESDWKHFLPRLLELSFDGNCALDLDWVGNKFSGVENGWKSWPDEEIAALQSFFHAVLEKNLEKRDWFWVESWLEQLARIGEELGAFAALENWLNRAKSEAILDLDEWRGEWDNVESHLDRWSRRVEIEELLLFRCFPSDDATF